MNTVAPSSLAQACGALWLATLSLMAAFMQTSAPAHRYLLARRVVRNLDTLAAQECFSAECRATFRRLALRWGSHALRYSPRQYDHDDRLKLPRVLKLR